MGEKEYDPDCDGCKRSEGNDRIAGGIIKLAGGWVLNQYQGDEGFLGWMALQPLRHCDTLTKLKAKELNALGRNIKRVELALHKYWQKRFPKDQIKRMYVIYFYESFYDKP